MWIRGAGFFRLIGHICFSASRVSSGFSNIIMWPPPAISVTHAPAMAPASFRPAFAGVIRSSLPRINKVEQATRAAAVLPS